MHAPTSSRSRLASCCLALAVGCGCPPASPEAEVAAPDPESDVPAAIARLSVPPPLDAPAPAVTPATVPPRRPHVVLVVLCTVRKDQLGVYGGPANTTPVLDGLASEGAVFDDAVASAPWTRAAATALLVGHDALDVGMVEPGNGRNERRLAAEHVTLAERLHDAGWATLGNTANPNLDAVYGFDQGFERYQEGVPSFPKQKLEATLLVDALLADARRSRDAGEARPLFLQTVLIDPHGPRHHEPELPRIGMQEGVPGKVVLYRRYLRRLDDALGRMVDGLTDLGLPEEGLLLVVVGDHGEGLGWPAWHGNAHGQYLAPSVTHVTWVMQGSGVAHGQRVRGLASQLDLTPTLLGTLGLPADDTLPGRDWSALVRGQGHVTDRQRAFVDTWFLGVNRAAIYTNDRACLLDLGSRPRRPNDIPFRGGCFDRRADPLFAHPFEDRALEDELRAWRVEHEQHLSPGEVAEGARELRRQLEALGYAEREEPE